MILNDLNSQEVELVHGSTGFFTVATTDEMAKGGKLKLPQDEEVGIMTVGMFFREVVRPCITK